MKYLRAVGTGLGLGLMLLAYCLLDIEVSLARLRITMLESSHRARNNEMVTLRKQLEELQSWRIHVTAASRMGWAQSARFIREFPLPELEVME